MLHAKQCTLQFFHTLSRVIGSISLVCALGLLCPLAAQAAGPMLPKVYQQGIDISGWLMSEKLDGVRGQWDGQQLRSKHGKPFSPPAAFTAGLPPFPVEGEIWGGRDSFEKTVGIVRRQRPDDAWLGLKLAIFDVPQAAGGFSSRIAKATNWFKTHPSPYAFVIPQQPVQTDRQLKQELGRVERLGGEGLIVRQPQALYTPGRSDQILKVKSYEDAEARVLAQLPGQGRNAGRLGALLVQFDNGIKFKIGSGFSDAERQAPPAVGALITFKFYGKYRSGIPKFPAFLRLRSDGNL